MTRVLHLSESPVRIPKKAWKRAVLLEKGGKKYLIRCTRLSSFLKKSNIREKLEEAVREAERLVETDTKNCVDLGFGDPEECREIAVGIGVEKVVERVAREIASLKGVQKVMGENSRLIILFDAPKAKKLSVGLLKKVRVCLIVENPREYSK